MPILYQRDATLSKEATMKQLGVREMPVTLFRGSCHRFLSEFRLANRHFSIAWLLFLAWILIPGSSKAFAQGIDNSPTDSSFVPSPNHVLSHPISELAVLVERFLADRGTITRRYSVDYSTARRNELIQLYTGWLSRLKELNFESLDQEGRIDYILLNNLIRSEIVHLNRDIAKSAEINANVPFATTIANLQDTRRELKAVDAPAAAQALTLIAKEADSLRKSLDNATASKTPLSKDSAHMRRVLALRSVQLVDDARRTLESWYGYYAGYDPLFTWWVSAPEKKAVESLRSYSKAIREKTLGVKEGDDDPIVGDPIGREGLQRELELAFIPYSPEELLQIAEREFAWCEAEMKKASREMGFGDNWKAALEKVKNSYVEPGKQPEMIAGLAREAIDFVDSRGLVTIPELAKNSWRMEMMSPARQKVSPFFLGGEVILVSYPTDSMSEEDKMMSMRGNNPHFSRATVQHELIPGHYLQEFMMTRYQPHRADAFYNPFWIEGWSLYWEMLLWDLNFPRSPEDKVGMLFWRSHRAARIIFSVKFHMGQMTPQEAVDFLVDRVGHERANAEGEVRRSLNGDYGPLYQLAYMLGGLQFRAMHKELVESGKMTDRQYHDAVLQGGVMPVEMVRARIEGIPLTRDFKTNWRFAGALPATASR